MLDKIVSIKSHNGPLSEEVQQELEGIFNAIVAFKCRDGDLHDYGVYVERSENHE